MTTPWTPEREAEARALLEGMRDGRWVIGVSPYRWYSRAASQDDLRDALAALATERARADAAERRLEAVRAYAEELVERGSGEWMARRGSVSNRLRALLDGAP